MSPLNIERNNSAASSRESLSAVFSMATALGPRTGGDAAAAPACKFLFVAEAVFVTAGAAIMRSMAARMGETGGAEDETGVATDNADRSGSAVGEFSFFFRILPGRLRL